MTNDLPDAVVQQLYDAIFAGRKIEAIKLYRESTGMGLMESKQFVDDLEADLRRESPQRFSAAAGKRGCAVHAAIALAAFAAVSIAWLW